MMNMHSKYDNMYRNGMFYALICIHNCVKTSISCMLSMVQGLVEVEGGMKVSTFRTNRGGVQLH